MLLRPPPPTFLHMHIQAVVHALTQILRQLTIQLEPQLELLLQPQSDIAHTIRRLNLAYAFHMITFITACTTLICLVACPANVGTTI
jgi:hypothetical protein